MLRLVQIDKIYKVASNDVKALDKVTLNFRKNEFVSILGPSGSGKTTLLNIVGGLDKYSDGDLIIAGKSTKEYKDRDWDFYRNQRIGFIFQSYNLIPHQNVLSNVELALTISGVSKNERIQRAKEALDKVGLSDQYYKKPNQLSGGQCQRVAIARALVNNPEILLADEPTGALDTKTSEQIMDLIREIAKDRLVIMVTHNPDLAERYSSRIIRLLDGRIVEDSNPFSDTKEIQEVASLDEGEVEKKSKAKMGLWTANKLSFKNLISKKGRTILVSIASSIGIIGISTVLAVSFGVTDFVTSMQDDMLSSYPLSIAEKSIDMTSLMVGLSNDNKKEIAEFDVTTQVGMESMINYLMDKYSDATNMKVNDINSTFVQYVDEMPSEYLAAKRYDYGIDITNNIFLEWTSSSVEGNKRMWVSSNGLTQRYIAELETVAGFEQYASYVDLFTNFMKEMPGDEQYILSQYDLLGNSSFPQNENEMALVVTGDSTLTDLLLGQLGFYSHDDFINIGQKAVQIYTKSDDPEKKGLKQKLDEGLINKATYDSEYAALTKKFPYKQIFNYEELLNKKFYYVPHSTMWEYSNVSNETSMTGSVLLVDEEEIYYLQYVNIMGYDALAGYKIDIKNGGDPSMTYFVRKESSVRDPNTFFNGVWAEVAGVSLPVEMTGKALNINCASKTATIIDTSSFTPIKSFTNIKYSASETGTVEGYNYPAEGKDAWFSDTTLSKAKEVRISAILKAKETTRFGSLSRGIYYPHSMAERYMEDANKVESKIINDGTYGIKQFYKSKQAETTTYGAYVTFDYVNYTDQDNPSMNPVRGYANALNGDLSESISSMFSSFLGGTQSKSTNQVYLRALSGLKAINDDGLYRFEKLPQELELYPTNFATKDKVTKYLDYWNSDDDLVIGGQTITALERSEITYTDTVAIIISVINSLITIVTSALIAFTSLSLVVSCFMIAVITYISVMERVKEIGVIRSLGGRKRDVSRLFTAENFMTGLASGLIGIGITYILSIIINVIVHYFGAPAIAALPWWMALIMIGLSIALNVISGFIPSQNAAKQDPVNALRSE